MAATVARLKELHAKVGNVGVDKLLHAAKKDNVPGVNRRIVQDFLSTDSAAQIFRPLPESKGKTASEGPGVRVQMDAVDYKTKKTTWQGSSYSIVLCLLDVASRQFFAAPCKTKSPSDVAPVLRRLLGQMTAAGTGIQKVEVISTDKGREWAGEVQELLSEKDIIHRTHEPADVNALSALDKAIQTFKRRLAQSLADKKGPWPGRVAEVVKQQNATFHPAIRDEPDDYAKEGHEVKRFLNAQDNAEKVAHNTQLLEKRKGNLEDQGGYRVPEGSLNKFRRGFQQAYSSDVKIPVSVRGSMVKDEEGKETDIKRIMPVNVFSGHASEGLTGANPRTSKIKDEMLEAMMLLYGDMDPGETRSLSSAARFLKEEMGAKYNEALKKARISKLVTAAELFDEFEVTRGGYYLKRR